MARYTPFDTQIWCPWNEPITIRSVRPNSTDVVVSGVQAARYTQQSGEVAPSYGVYTRDAEKWTFATNDIPFEIKLRDTITPADGVSRTVIDTAMSDIQNFSSVTAINLVLAADLRDSGTLYRPTNTADAAGKRIPGLAAINTGVACRVQKMTGSGSQAVNTASTVRVTAVAYIGQQLYPQVGDVFGVGSTKYAVLGWKDPDRINALMAIDLGDIS